MAAQQDLPTRDISPFPGSPGPPGWRAALQDPILSATMKITLLTYLESEDDKSPDPVVEPVAAALQAGGHEVSVLGVHGDLKKLLSGLTRRQADLVFNLMEMFGSNLFGDVAVTGLLELLGLPFTGGGP